MLCNWEDNCRYGMALVITDLTHTLTIMINGYNMVMSTPPTLCRIWYVQQYMKYKK